MYIVSVKTEMMDGTVGWIQSAPLSHDEADRVKNYYAQTGHEVEMEMISERNRASR
jgi:hypothetical protein